MNIDVGQILGKNFSPDEDPFENHTANTLKGREADVWPIKDMPGYFMAWGGEAEDPAKAQDGLKSYIPIYFGLMIMIVISLFNSIKKTLIIWLVDRAPGAHRCHCRPADVQTAIRVYAFAGFDKSGRDVNKNAIVLIDQAYALTVPEAVVGQLYLALMIARLVGIHISHSVNKKDK